jgi:protein phosphatase
VITRALGTDPDVTVDTYTIEPEPDDVFLLCSDGLTSMVGDDVILRIVEEHRRDLDEAARQLVASANQGGGEDNITVVFFAIAPEGATEPPPAATPKVEPAPSLADDEDTLSGIERVPAVQTIVVPVEQLRELRDAPPAAPEPGDEAEVVLEPERAPDPEPQLLQPAPDASGTSRRKRTLVILAVLAVIGAVVALVIWGLSS